MFRGRICSLAPENRHQFGNCSYNIITCLPWTIYKNEKRWWSSSRSSFERSRRNNWRASLESRCSSKITNYHLLPFITVSDIRCYVKSYEKILIKIQIKISRLFDLAKRLPVSLLNKLRLRFPIFGRSRLSQWNCVGNRDETLDVPLPPRFTNMEGLICSFRFFFESITRLLADSDRGKARRLEIFCSSVTDWLAEGFVTEKS